MLVAAAVFESSLVAEHPREEVREDGVFLGELCAEATDRLHHHDLEFVTDLRDEGIDLLHEAAHGRLCAGLEEHGDGESRDGTVRVGDEVLRVYIARGHSGREYAQQQT